MEYLLTSKAASPVKLIANFLIRTFPLPLVHDTSTSKFHNVRGNPKYLFRNIAYTIVVLLTIGRQVLTQAYTFFMWNQDSNASIESLFIWILVSTTHLISLTMLSVIVMDLDSFLCLMDFINDVVKSEDALIAVKKVKRKGNFRFLLECLTMMAGGSMLMFYPGVLYAVHFELPFFKYFKFPYIYPFVVFVWASGFVHDWAIVLIVAFCFILGLIALIVWMDRATNHLKSQMNDIEYEKIHRFYRTFQLHAIVTLEMVSLQAPILVILSEAVIILGIFVVIRQYVHSFVQIAYLILFIIAGIVLMTCAILSSLVLESCREFKHKTTLCNKKCGRSYRLIFFRMAKVFTFERETWPIILHEVIIQNLINLLLL